MSKTGTWRPSVLPRRRWCGLANSHYCSRHSVSRPALKHSVRVCSGTGTGAEGQLKLKLVKWEVGNQRRRDNMKERESKEMKMTGGRRGSGSVQQLQDGN